MTKTKILFLQYPKQAYQKPYGKRHQLFLFEYVISYFTNDLFCRIHLECVNQIHGGWRGGVNCDSRSPLSYRRACVRKSQNQCQSSSPKLVTRYYHSRSLGAYVKSDVVFDFFLNSSCDELYVTCKLNIAYMQNS